MKKNILITSLKKPFALINKHRNLFALLFVLQFIFFVVMFYVNIHYQTKIMEDAQAIVDILDKQQLTDEDVAMNLLGQGDLIEESASLYSASRAVAKNVGILAGLSFAIYIILGGLLWAFTDQFTVKKDVKRFFVYIGKFTVITIAYSIIGFTFMMQAGSGLKDGSPISYLWIGLIPFVFYFAFISYALVGKLSIKEIAKQTFSVGIKKAHYILLVYLINILLIAIIGFAMYLALERMIFLLTLSLILFLLAYVWARLFLIEAIGGFAANSNNT